MVEEPARKPVVVTNDFVRFLASVCHPNVYACPCCGHTEWNVGGLQNAGQPVSALVYAKKPRPDQHATPILPDTVRPYIVTECLKCGYTRLFLYYRVLDWLIANPDTGEPDAISP